MFFENNLTIFKRIKSEIDALRALQGTTKIRSMGCKVGFGLFTKKPDKCFLKKVKGRNEEPSKIMLRDQLCPIGREHSVSGDDPEQSNELEKT